MSGNNTSEFTPELERYELSERPKYSFQLGRRDFVKVTGGGLLVLFVMKQALAGQESGRGRGEFRGNALPQDIGAWLHIDEDGVITAYTGKVEMGQEIRTSLTQAIAEELKSPIESIKLVMGDTDLTPFDMGTFGSQTTPRMASELHKVAASARESLIDLACEQWKADRSTVTVEGGKVIGHGLGQSLTFAQLTKGRQLTRTVSDDSPVTPAIKWTIAGQPVKKIGAVAVVTGRHKYTSDVKLPGML
ncbi:MAG TPA: molybdopterin cofactor-binding domain-containing protein, partial [Blastocatellia bacterium]